MNIGFIGLGIMGKPMAKNLLKAGHDLIVLDHHEENINEIVKCGAVRALSNKEIGEKSDVVITMLPNSPHVKEVILGEDGVLSGAKPGLIIIDTSSISPKVSKEIFEECIKKDVHYLDSPVSGGDVGAIKGTLALMVGGEKEVFDKVKDDILLKVGSTATYVGSAGSGNATKLCNNIIVASNLAAIAEGVSLTSKFGVDPESVFNAIKGGLAGSKAMDIKLPQMIDGNFNPGFKIDLHIKDLNNAEELAKNLQVELPITDIVIEMFNKLSNNGEGNLDHSAVAKYYEQINDCSIKK